MKTESDYIESPCITELTRKERELNDMKRVAWIDGFVSCAIVAVVITLAVVIFFK